MAAHLAFPNDPPRHRLIPHRTQSCPDAKEGVAPRRTTPITTAETNLVIA
jgi:hypothetical protein